MNMWSQFLLGLRAYVPFLAVVALAVAALALANWFLLRQRSDLGAEARFPRQLLLMAMTSVGLVLLILLFPMSETTREQILSLIGLLLTAVIALSSTSFVSNIMAGLMLRVIKSFRPGDFIRIGDNFGRITERGLVHTEIQTQNRDLTTFPNLFLITNPVTVMRSSGTIVSTTLTLGYDLPRGRIETLLIKAAEASGLQDAFVQIEDLGDFSVSYRVAGFLPKVKHLLTVRSDLRKQVLDILHGSGIEIVSPTFMNQRRLADGVRVIPQADLGRPTEKPSPAEKVPEQLIFDKAEEAEKLERLRTECANMKERVETLNRVKKSADEETQRQLQSQIEWIEKHAQGLARQVKEAQNKADSTEN